MNKSSILWICLSCISCSNNHSIPIIDLQKSSQSTIVRLSDMISDIKFIKLETTKESLLGSNTVYLVNEKSIVTIDDEKILQFSAKGNYIRRLAISGNGPEEFQRVNASTLDEKNNLLYINHRGDRRNIIVFDLNSGKRVDRIPTGVDNLISRIIVEHDSALAIQPRMNKEYNLFYLSNSGEIKGGFSPPKVRNIGLETTVIKVKDKLYYMPKEYDTLYLLSNTSKKPYCYFRVDDRFSLENHETGNFIYVLSNAPTFMIVNKIHANITLNSDGETFAMNGDKATQYWIDKRNNFSVNEISGFQNDFLGIDELFDPWTNYLSVSNNLAFRVYSSIELIQLIEKSQNSQSLDKEVNDRRTLLFKQINENDNPLLIIGKLKSQ